MHPKNQILIIFFVFFSTGIFAQEKKSVRNNNLKSAAKELSKSLEEEKPNDVLAQDYEKLAKEQASVGEFAKAEENLEKARRIYQRLNDKERLANVERELAKVQEAQRKTDKAITNYQSASKRAINQVQMQMNVNDANRLMNQSNAEIQAEYIQQNIDLLEDTEYSDDKVSALQQMADYYISIDASEKAIAKFDNVLKEVKDNPTEAIRIKKEMANVYAKEQNFEKEIETLQQAYQLAIEQKNTLEVRKIVEMLATAYNETNNTAQILALYADFNSKLESLVLSDSSLFDSEIYQHIEERITQLEKERELKDELIKRKNTLNYIFIISIVLILISLAFVIRALIAINKKNKKIALQSLRREMNPHFIFNSLNSVNHFIAQNNELEANKYLSSYSKLMRNTMENSNKDFIPLSVEIAQLKEYLQLEYMRFSDKFNYVIDVDAELDTDAVYVPNMLIQPQLENAIWHGLRYTEKQGMLSLAIKKDSTNLQIIIEDNGIGLKRSQELKTVRQKEHISRGMTNTRERIKLLNDLYHTNISIKVIDKEGEQSGVIVILEIPDSRFQIQN